MATYADTETLRLGRGIDWRAGLIGLGAGLAVAGMYLAVLGQHYRRICRNYLRGLATTPG